jgi:hypothetical protein
MKPAAIVVVLLIAALLAVWMIVPKDVGDTVSGAMNSTPSTAPRSTKLLGMPNQGSASSDSSTKASGVAAVALTPAQRFAIAPNYKKLYDELSELPDETGEARYFMGKAVAACNLFIGFKLEAHERVIGSTQYIKREAFRELSQQCEGFYGFKGPSASGLWKQAAAKGYPGAVAATLTSLPRSEAEVTAARLLEGGNPQALESLLSYLEPRSKFSTLEVDGQRAPPDVLAEAWRLYACDRGADCGPFLFERCWAASECGAADFQSYLRDFKPQSYSLVRRFESEIARAVESRDWRTLGVVTSETR